MAKKKEAKTKEVGKKAEEKMPERMKAEEIESLVVELAKQGNHPAKIGQILKEKHNVPKIKLLGKSITKILKEKNIDYKPDSKIVGEKLKKIEDHYTKNRQDKKSEREIVRLVSLKKRLESYELGQKI